MDKARVLRLHRLRDMLNEYLTHAPLALETLVSELKVGAAHLADWRALHAAAARDDCEMELGIAYQKLVTRHRLDALPVESRVFVLMHAADFFEGVLGDEEVALEYLQQVIDICPAHFEAFGRAERQLKSLGQNHALVRLYAKVALHPPLPAQQLATRVINAIVPLPTSSPLDEDVLYGLVPLVTASPSLLGVLDGHCRRTGRLELACALRERVLADIDWSAKARHQQQRDLLHCYEALPSLPATALLHVEPVLATDPGDPVARQCAMRLLKVRSVASRAAATLRTARRSTRPPLAGTTIASASSSRQIPKVPSGTPPLGSPLRAPLGVTAGSSE